jgi:hypothetical protein
MPVLLRKIRLNRWLKPDDLSWLPPGEIQADPLGDLATTKNDLSVWEIDDEQSNLDAVLVAYSLTTQRIDDLAYRLINVDDIVAIHIEIKNTEMPTKVKGVGEFHRDLSSLSATKLIETAKLLMDKGKTGQILSKRIFELIDIYISSGHLDKSKLSRDHLAQYREFKAKAP